MVDKSPLHYSNITHQLELISKQDALLTSIESSVSMQKLKSQRQLEQLLYSRMDRRVEKLLKQQTQDYEVELILNVKLLAISFRSKNLNVSYNLKPLISTRLKPMFYSWHYMKIMSKIYVT